VAYLLTDTTGWLGWRLR